jgi:ribosomal protein S18 acetylase RimI-like enzyme
MVSAATPYRNYHSSANTRDTVQYQFTYLSDQVRTASAWADFDTLLHEYAEQDLAQPRLSTIWKDLDDLPARYGSPVGGVVLLHQDHILVGCMAFTASKFDGTCELKRLFVRKSFRGKGYARILLTETMRMAKQAGYFRGVLSTWPDNPKALELYSSLGFMPTESFKEDRRQNLVFLGMDL